MPMNGNEEFREETTAILRWLTMKRVVVLAMILLGLAVPTVANAAVPDNAGAIPVGVWAGTYTVGERQQFFRVALADAQNGGQPNTTSGIVRLVRGDLRDVDVAGSRIRFRLSDESGTLQFDGARDSDTISGTVGVVRSSVAETATDTNADVDADAYADERGSFVLQREVPIELADYRRWLGPYRLVETPGDSSGADAGRSILIMNGDTDRPRPGYFENDRFVTMYPVAPTSFISELGERLEFKLASADAPLRLHAPAGEVYVGKPNDEYGEEQVEFGSSDVRLTGSLLVPNGDGPYPVVILIHGSQGSDRELYRPYADHFARHGIAALMYDKRGTGSSTGNWRQAGFDALTDDVLAAAELLKSHPQMDPHSIGVWGISQGGWIVALAARRDPDIAFVIGVSAAGTTPGRQEAYRVRNVLVDSGLKGISLELAMAWNRLLYPVGHFVTKPYLPLPSAVKDMAGGLAVSPLFNPEPVWRQVRQPVLLMYGEVNWLVDPVESPALIGTALERGGNTNYTIATFERGDHNIRVTETGTPSEILREIRYAPGYFQAKPDWV
jgi:dienelactone hydrolase